MLAWQQLESLISESERVLLTTHVRPDGDALGSELAMADLLLQKGKEVEIFNVSKTPQRYQFLDPTGTRIRWRCQGVSRPAIDPDLLLVLDTGTWTQLAELTDYVRALAAPKVVIDHHLSQDDLGALALIDTAAAATAMLIYEAFLQFHGAMTREAATALFVGVAMDTGWMRHPTTTPEVYRVQGELVAAGARPHEIYQHLYESNSIARQRLLGRMLGRLVLLMDGRLASSSVLAEDVRAAGAHPMDTEDFIDFAMALGGVETALLFIEQRNNGTKVSFRTRSELDCRRLAEQFGGGGHKQAAGASLKVPIDQARAVVIQATERAMSQL